MSLTELEACEALFEPILDKYTEVFPGKNDLDGFGEKRLDNVIGEGTFASVHRFMKTNEDGSIRPVAVKKYKMGNLRSGIPSAALMEISYLKEINCAAERSSDSGKLNDQFTVERLDVWMNERVLHLSMDYADCSLYDIFDGLFKFDNDPELKSVTPSSRKRIDLYRAVMSDINFIRFLVSCIAKGYRDFSSLELLHRDIKPGNLLLSGSRGKLVFCDFGLAARTPESRDRGELMLSEKLLRNLFMSTEKSGKPVYPLDITVPPELLPVDFNIMDLDIPYNSSYSRNITGQWTGKMQPQVATVPYRSPELLFASQSHSHGVDSWAIGCVLMELVRSHLFSLSTPAWTGETASKLEDEDFLEEETEDSDTDASSGFFLRRSSSPNPMDTEFSIHNSKINPFSEFDSSDEESAVLCRTGVASPTVNQLGDRLGQLGQVRSTQTGQKLTRFPPSRSINNEPIFQADSDLSVLTKILKVMGPPVPWLWPGVERLNGYFPPRDLTCEFCAFRKLFFEKFDRHTLFTSFTVGSSVNLMEEAKRTLEAFLTKLWEIPAESLLLIPGKILLNSCLGDICSLFFPSTIVSDSQRSSQWRPSFHLIALNNLLNWCSTSVKKEIELDRGILPYFEIILSLLAFDPKKRLSSDFFCSHHLVVSARDMSQELRLICRGP